MEENSHLSHPALFPGPLIQEVLAPARGSIRSIMNVSERDLQTNKYHAHDANIVTVNY